MREFLFCIFTTEKFSQIGSSGGSDSECEEFGLPGKFFNGGAVLSKTTRVLFAVVACAFVVTQATAQDEFKPSVSVGGGLRAGVSFGDDADNYGLNNTRLYINASAASWLSLEVNSETSFGGETDLPSGDELGVTLLDAVAKISLSDNADVWVGRFLAPSDRANLSGPYYGNVGNNGLASASSYYMGGNKQAGRDDGVMLTGGLPTGGVNLKYSIGIFDGGADDDQMIAARVVLNLWDDEPGYYNASTYFGEKEIFAIGVSFQSDSDGGAGGGGNEDASEVDLLVEKNLDMGTVTLDAAYYDNDSEENPYSVFVGLLLGNEIAIGPMSGKPRPYVSISDTGIDDEFSLGVQYVIDGHKANLSVEYSDSDLGGSTFGIGAQFQF